MPQGDSQFSMLGWVLIAFGAVYLIKPTIFMRWFWKRTAISQRLLTPEQNIIYMRILGGVLIVAAIAIVALGVP